MHFQIGTRGSPLQDETPGRVERWLKELVAETVLENRLLKKSVTGSDLPEDEA